MIYARHGFFARMYAEKTMFSTPSPKFQPLIISSLFSLFRDDDIGKSGFFEHLFQFLHGNCAGDSAAVSFFILLYSFGELTLFQNIRDRKSPSRL